MDVYIILRLRRKQFSGEIEENNNITRNKIRSDTLTLFCGYILPDDSAWFDSWAACYDSAKLDMSACYISVKARHM